MANRNFPNKGNLYSPHALPKQIDCRFVVQSADSAGLGITTLASSGYVKSVFMNSSATAAAAAAGSPNPAAGIIQVRFNDNYRRLISVAATFNGPQATASTSTVANVVNVISVLGTATLAQWRAVGLPIGITPAVGVAFIATSAALIGGSAQTILATATGAGIGRIETIGDPNLSISPDPTSSAGIGGYVYLRCYSTNTLTAPANGTQIRLTFLFNDSSVLGQSSAS